MTVKSFDGLPISGFLYAPDPTKFPGKRPLIIDIHSGPEGQTRPGHLGRANNLINETGSGSNDPRAKPSEPYQMVEAVRGQGGTAWHLIAADKGHGFQTKANQDFEFLTRLMCWDPVLK